MKRLTIHTFILLLLLVLSFCSSRTKSLIKDLPPEDKDFLSNVRYIIEKHEKKEFLRLTTDKERQQFIIDFWKKRDPDPTTEENEFREVYFKRIEEANHLFSQGGSKGWLSDRGRVYVILGPPETKQVYPTGYGFYDRPSEVWYYGFFPIVFVDRSHSGNYELTPLGAKHVSELNKAQLKEIPWIKKEEGEKRPFDFDLKLQKNKKENRYTLQIILPYRSIVFKEKKNVYSASVTAHIHILEIKKNIFQTLDKDVTVTVKEDELNLLDTNYVTDVPLKLAPGKYEVTVVLESKADEVKVRNKIVFKI